MSESSRNVKLDIIKTDIELELEKLIKECSKTHDENSVECKKFKNLFSIYCNINTPPSKSKP